jgi:ABC-2 type transport system ATP-binding protein
MTRLGQKELRIELREPIAGIPEVLADFDLTLAEDGQSLRYGYKVGEERTGITRLLAAIQSAGLVLVDLQTNESSLEDIFVGLVHDGEAA